MQENKQTSQQVNENSPEPRAKLESRADLEQKIEILQQQLAHAQKLTALGELVSTTTHEFNNVLMTIINYAKLGLRHRDTATREKSFNKILSAGNRAAKITNSVLGIARNRGSEREPTDLVSLIEESLVLLEREMSKYRISIDRKFDDVPEAMVNGNQIQQVLLNLLINARQAMPSGGQLVIKLAVSEEEGMIDLIVRDYGTGIPADKLRNIFDPFFSTKKGPDASGKGGTGLGLSMCRDIIESHHGRIRVDSAVGRGTAFTLKIPIARQEAPATDAPIVQPVSMAPTMDQATV